MLRIETRPAPGTARRLRYWLSAEFLSTYPLLVGAWLAASGNEARFVLFLIGVASILSLVNLIVVPMALVQDRRTEVGPEGIRVLAKVGPLHVPWSSVRWVRVWSSPAPQGPVAFLIGGPFRRCIVTVYPAENPESIVRLRSALARYAPTAKRKGAINHAVWDPTGPADGEFRFVDSSWSGLWVLFSLVVAVASASFQLALVLGPEIIPVFTVRLAVVLFYFAIAAGFVSAANWMTRISTSGASDETPSRLRRVAKLGGASVMAASAILTLRSLG